MATMNLVTGYTGQAHVTAADDGALNAALVGSGQYVLPSGNKLSASAVTNNTIRVMDGDALMQGRHIRIEPGTSVDLTIENGAVGYYRNDLIVIRYAKEASTGVESATLTVIKGTANTTAGTDPVYTSGDVLRGGAIANDMPLYRVVLEGLSIKEIVPLYEMPASVSDHTENRNNPHEVTCEQISAATVDHTHTPDALGAAAQDHAHVLESLSNVHVVTSTPGSVIEGHWYLVKES